MNLSLNSDLSTVSSVNYSSNSQTARVLTERWFRDECYCVSCGEKKLCEYRANYPGVDFFCDNCGADYQLKATKSWPKQSVPDGAFASMITAITHEKPPIFAFLHYRDSQVRNLEVLPAFCLTESHIQRRKPLSSTARRAGWVGCNILLGEIPQTMRMHVVRDGVENNKADVVAQYANLSTLARTSLVSRSWIVEIARIVEGHVGENFVLSDIYSFESELHNAFPENSNIKPKIRQQLQILRDMGIIEFLGNGHYRKLKRTR